MATQFHVDAISGDIFGPEDYMQSAHFAATKAKIEDGSHVLLNAGLWANDQSLDRLLEVIFQTDYAAYKGAREIAALSIGSRA